ncbi:MAG: hypothetical protein QM642_09410 [Edaphocola sp.]
MANKYQDWETLRVDREAGLHLVRIWRSKLDEHLPTIRQDDILEQILWMQANGVAKELDKLLNPEKARASKKNPSYVDIQMDFAQMLSLAAYWGPVELPAYEDNLMRKLIWAMDSSMTTQKNKSI